MRAAARPRASTPNDLRALEDLVKTLARLPVEAWEGKPATRGHRGRRRRAAAQLRERAARDA